MADGAMERTANIATSSLVNGCWRTLLPLLQIAGITFAFFVLEIPLAWLTHRIGLRDHPY